jgi:hypothetical protein
MPKTAMLTLLAAATLGAGAALASERAAVEPTAPSFVRELGTAGVATVGGTVLEVRSDGHFVLADAEDRTIVVDAADLRLDDLKPAQMITVMGRLDEAELEARYAIREDGSVAVLVAESDDEEEDERD